ncbi:unnamed protein product [Rotaria sp. Silwood1]|nr:unnamed protein product [Rotaria sp. Silwood1]CAF1172345.1 unnamed protein product [Rotaria sp. Silwood1]
MSHNQLVLLDAIEKGHTSIVLKLLRNHVDLNIKDIYGRTPLMIAAKNGRSDIVKILLEHIGTKDIEVDHGGKTALHYAAENSELSVIKILSKHQAASTIMTTTQTKLLPLDYVLDNDDIYPSLNKYTQGGQVSAGETDDDDDNVPKAGIYIKTKKKSSEEIALTDLSTSSRDEAREASSVPQITPLVNPLNSIHIKIVKQKREGFLSLMF